MRTTLIHCLMLLGFLLLSLPLCSASTSVGYYSFTGQGNNVEQPSWGSANSTRVRILPPMEAGGSHRLPRDEGLPSARRIMEVLFRTAKPLKDKPSNHLLLEFGHLITQDIVGSMGKNASEPFPMPCDGKHQDYVFCPVTQRHYDLTIAEHTMEFYRAPHTIDAITGARATLNSQSAYLDLSYLYGNTPEERQQIRTHEDGLLHLDEKEQLPPSHLDLAKYNTSPGVYVLYVVFMRLHNYMARQYAQEDESLDDEALFQKARRYAVAVYQSTCEEKYIPIVLGRTLPPYQGYDANTDPSIDEFFASTSFRYAHSSFSSLVRLLDEDWHPLPQDPLFLRDTFHQAPPNDVPSLVRRHGGIEPFLRGMVVSPAKAVDASIVDDLNFFSRATSLLDVQRGRDLGIPPYNSVRRGMNLTQFQTLDEIMDHSNDPDALEALRVLYNDDIDKVDAMVGALLEPPLQKGDNLGPLFTLSILDQFARIRDGDRFWYKHWMTAEELASLPSLTDVIQWTCDDMDVLPTDSFLAWDGHDGAAGEDDGTCGAAATQLSLMGGDYLLGWNVDMPGKAERAKDPELRATIDVTMTLKVPMEDPGFVGVGWGSQTMSGAEMWFCRVNEEPFETSPLGCSHDMEQAPEMFSCCLGMGKQHVASTCSSPKDDMYYDLDVVDWCITEESAMVMIRAPVCDDDDDSSTADSHRNCFRLASTEDDKMDFIVAYNPNRVSNHGYIRRTSAQMDLRGGVLTQSEAGVADSGIIATHAFFMLFAWMVIAPFAVFVVRYLKTRTWRLAAHISLMSVVGSLMVPLLIGVEASVGATDKSQDHAVVGLFMMVFYFVMASAGKIRLMKLNGKRVGKKADFLSLLVHRYGGLSIIIAGWCNCYTGLIRISPEDSYVQVTLFSSVPLGYDIPVFGIIKEHIFFPWIAIVCVIFIAAEIRRYRTLNNGHAKGVLNGDTSIFDDIPTDRLERMTMENFLDLTKMGTDLCIIAGHVLDVTDFAENHPGGRHLLRYARGSDITEEFAGVRDVDGFQHTHSRGAIELMKTLVKGVLVEERGRNLAGIMASSVFSLPKSSKSIGSMAGRGRSDSRKRGRLVQGTATTSSRAVFRRGRIVEIQYLTPEIEITQSSKPVILLRLALPKTDAKSPNNFLNLPGCAFTFRGLTNGGATVERQYTPVKLRHMYRQFNTEGDEEHEDEEVLDFIISLVPNGKMSRLLLEMRKGKLLLVQGPTINPDTVNRFKEGRWESILLIAAGTGIAPMLQVIDYYLSQKGIRQSLRGKKEMPRLFLVWVTKGEEYDYGNEIGLDQLVDISDGRFRYTIIYSASSRNAKNSKDGSTDDSDNKAFARYGGWNFKSIIAWPSFLPYAKQKVKSLVLNQRSRRSNSLGVDMDSTSRRQAITYHGKELKEGIWSGPPQCNVRQYDKDLIEELLESIPLPDRNLEGESARISVEKRPLPPLVEESSGFGTEPSSGFDLLVDSAPLSDDGIINNESTQKQAPSGEEQEEEEIVVAGSFFPDEPVDVEAGSLPSADNAKLFHQKNELLQQPHAYPTTVRPANIKTKDINEPGNPATYAEEEEEEEESPSNNKNLLVAISGPPMFEYKSTAALRDLGLSKDHVLTFHAASSHKI